MRSLVACFGVFLACCLIPQTACMTNREFVDLMMDSAEAVEEYYPGDDSYYVEDDGTIQLPGGPDDELDLEYLMVQSGLPDRMMTQLATLSRSTPERSALGWWRRRRRTSPRPTGCSCRNKSCHCCASHTFRLNLLIKKVSFTLHACSYVTYLTGEGIELRFTLNNRNMFHKQMSIRYPPTMCYGVPGLKYFAKACLRLYNVNLVRKSFCLKVEGQLNLLFKKYRVNLKLGCYRVVAPNEEELGSLLNDSEALMTYLTSGDPSIDKTGSIKLTETRSLQELMQHAEITEIDQEDETMETS